MWHAAMPAWMYFWTVRATLAGPPKPVSASAMTGVVGSRRKEMNELEAVDPMTAKIAARLIARAIWA